jgi:hypothetical protein
MAVARIRIEFDSDESASFERNVEFTDLSELGDKRFVASYIFSEVEAQSRWGLHLMALPSVDMFLRPVRQTFQMDELASGSYEDRTNTRAVWMDIVNTLLHVRSLLAQSMSYDEQERLHLASGEPEAENLSWHSHMNKLERFDVAVGSLGKTCDLVARLIFERLGAMLLDRSKPGWQLSLKLKAIRKGLSDRTVPPANLLSVMEYQELVGILDDFLSTEPAQRTRHYRNRVTHHIKPSVDRRELYSHLESRETTPVLDENGQVKGWTKGFGGISSVAEYSFACLYQDAVQNFQHYISLLQRLEAMPRFSLEAIEPSVPAAQV